MSGETLAELREAIVAARSEFDAALRLAADRWEDEILEREDGVSEAWAPHMAAAHAILGERWRFRYLEMVLGTSAGAEPPTFDDFAASPAGQEELAERRERYEAMDGVGAALDAAAEVWSELDERFGRWSEADLVHPAGLAAGQLDYLGQFEQTASNDVRGCLLLASVHLRDHAQSCAPPSRTVERPGGERYDGAAALERTFDYAVELFVPSPSV
jgi:hypothetical protein